MKQGSKEAFVATCRGHLGTTARRDPEAVCPSGAHPVRRGDGMADSSMSRRRWLENVVAALLAGDVWYGWARPAVAHAVDRGSTADADALIANGWPAHASVLMMLGAVGRIAATVNAPAQRPWMYQVAPSLHTAIHAPKGGLVAEALLARHVRLAFLTPGDPAVRELEAAGIRVIQTVFQDFASMRDSVTMTAQVLGHDAPARARRYLQHLDEELAAVREISSRIPPDSRPCVLHVVQWSPQLLVDGAGTMIDEWIRAAGGRNAADSIHGSLRPVSVEQLLAWNPDVIIQSASSARQRKGEGVAQLPAMRSGRLLTNPEGVFPWDRYGCEITLQLRWALGQLHPESRIDVDLPVRVRTFYRRFFDYDLSLADAGRMLRGEPPVGGRA